MSTSILRPYALSRLTVAAVLWCSAWQAVAANPVDVGQVSLLIGQAWVVRADGTQQSLQRGSAIRVGDRVETAANGHVHMRFIDNAAVSVRPESVLQVQAYHFDAQNPKANEVRLRVDKGASRSISGAATDLDKTRFRLNTPIAAIGVRGTDFIVQTDPTGVRATVADGTIVVSALGESCPATDLGPCVGQGVRELSAGMGRLMAEVRPGDRAARIVPAADAFTATAAAAADQSSGQRPISLDAARASGISAAEPTAAEMRRGNDRAAADLLTLAAVNASDINRATTLAGPSNLSNQLVWGRWAIIAEPTDRLSVPFSLARLDRHVTVADEQMGLFRADQSVPGSLFPDTFSGKVEFGLYRASAVFEQGTKVEAASVNASNLTIDFSRRTFATGLDLASASGVKGELRMAGDLRADGNFAVRDVDQRIAGTISLDGKEAGYLFERNAGGGLFRGRTLWGR